MRICKWLRHFQDFKGYVESFCFHPFVNERYEIVDITEAKLTWEDGDGYGFALDVPVLNGESVKDYRASKMNQEHKRCKEAPAGADKCKIHDGKKNETDGKPCCIQTVRRGGMENNALFSYRRKPGMKVIMEAVV